ncbi:hypothetical protein ACF08W_31515 [Streptomyces sp. NPDC015144]|uniref:hypothetical protein n=1 Tax=Streptomyces sp. NPDC015144 TaxID=3364944 RepID=UPI0036FFCC56
MTLNRLSPTAARNALRPRLLATVETLARCRGLDQYDGLFNRAPDLPANVWPLQQAAASSFCSLCPARPACEELELRYGNDTRTSDTVVRGGRRGQELAIDRECRQTDRLDDAVAADQLEAAREQFTLAYTLETGPVTRRMLRRPALERLGEMVMRLADRGAAWNIAVYDAAGKDVTFNFAFTAEDAALPAAA